MNTSEAFLAPEPPRSPDRASTSEFEIPVTWLTGSANSYTEA